jgi:hypothetical protein
MVLAATETRLARFRKADNARSKMIAKSMRQSEFEFTQTRGFEKSQSHGQLSNRDSRIKAVDQSSQDRLQTFRIQQERMMLQVADNVSSGSTSLGASHSSSHLLSERKRRKKELHSKKQKRIEDLWYQKTPTLVTCGLVLIFFMHEVCVLK